jgi:ABC-type sugar transport system substrate-binding protein
MKCKHWRSSLLVAIGIAPLVVACGSSGGSSAASPASPGTSASAGTSACVQKASAYVAPLEASSGSLSVTPLSGSVSALRGKTLWFLAPLSIPTFLDQANGIKTAAAPLGIKVHTFDTQGEASLDNQGLSEAVSAGAAGIFIDGVATALVAAELGDVAAAHIPVISFYEHPSNAETASAVNYTIDSDDLAIGKALGAEAAVLTGCQGTVGQLYTTVFSASVLFKDGVGDELKALCAATCKQATAQLGSSDISADGPTAATLVRRTNAKVIITTGDSDVPYIEAAFQQSGLNAAIIGGSGSPPAIKALGQANNLLKIDASPPSDEYVAFLGMDAMLHVLEKSPVPTTDAIPERFVTAAILAQDNNVVFPDLAGFQAKFEAAWKG